MAGQAFLLGVGLGAICGLGLGCVLTLTWAYDLLAWD